MAPKSKTSFEFPYDRILRYDEARELFIWILPRNENFIKAINKVKSAEWNRSVENAWTTPLWSLRQAFRLAQGFNFTFAKSVDKAVAEYFQRIQDLSTDEVHFEVHENEIRVFTKPPKPKDFMSQALLGELRLIDGRDWKKEGNYWSIPASSIRQVRDWCELFRIDVSPLRTLPDFDPVREHTINFIDDAFEISFPNDRDLREAVGEIPGADYDRERNVWRVDPSASDFVAEFAKNFNGHVDDESRRLFEEQRPRSERFLASLALDAELAIPSTDGVPVIHNAEKLYGYQKAGVKYCLDALGFQEAEDHFWSRSNAPTQGGVLNADDMGLGKSLQSLVVTELTQMYPLVIVAPAGVKHNWENEVRMWLPHRTVSISEGNATQPIIDGCDITIIGWSTLHSSAEVLTPKTVIFDEFHEAKTKSTRQSKAALKLANNVRMTNGIVIGLSGTPILNRPSELEAILTILGQIDEFGGSAGFKKRYAKDPKNRVELYERLRSTCMLRRTKKDALPQLPGKIEIEIPMQGDSDIMREYRKFEMGILPDIEVLFSNAQDKDALRKAFNAQRTTFMTKLNQLKHIAAKAKLAEVADFLDSKFLSSGKKIVVFCEHRDICEWISTNYANGCLIYGGVKDKDRRKLIHTFQNDPDQHVMVCSIEAAGVGINLTAASHVLFVEQDWNPGKQDQAASRCHRLGQTDEVVVYTSICEGTVDKPLLKFINDKREMIDQIMDGKKVTSSDDELILNLLSFMNNDKEPLPFSWEESIIEAEEAPTNSRPEFEAISLDEYIESQPLPKGRKVDGVFWASGDSKYHISLDCPAMNFQTRTYRVSPPSQIAPSRDACIKCPTVN